MGGVVYHSNYLNFCERARSELFFAKGSSPLFEGGHFVVRHLEADFRRPARLGDLLDVTVEVREIGSASLTMYQQVLRDGELLFEMTVKVAYVMLDGRIGRLDSGKKKTLMELLEN
jgi:acyl-CoA thioester hydrolase